MKYSTTIRKHSKKHSVSKTRKSRGGKGRETLEIEKMGSDDVTNERNRLREQVKELEEEVEELKENEPLIELLLQETIEKLSEIINADGQSHNYGHLHPNVIQKVLDLKKSQNRLKKVTTKLKKDMKSFQDQDKNIYDPHYELFKRTRRS